MSVLSDAATDPLLLADDRVFSGEKRFTARNVRLLELVGPILRRVLEPDERVLFIAPALAPAPLPARAVLGSALDHFARCVLLATDRRIVQVGSTRELTKCETVSQVRFGSVERMKVSMLTLTLTVRYRNGRRETWSRLTRHDARQLRAVIDQRDASAGAAAYDDRERLCPRCLAPLAAATPACAACRLAFKSPLRAALAALLPGGGYAYARQPSAAVLDIVVHVFLALAAIGALSLQRSGIILSASRTLLWTGAGLAVWKLLMIAHARRLVANLLPDENAGRTAAAAREAVGALRELARRNEYTWVESPPPPPLRVASEPAFGVAVASGQFDAATRAEQLRCIESLAPLLRRTLEEGEVVVFTSPGSPRFVFADFVSPMMVVLLMKRSVYVFTDRRILHVPLTTFGRPRHNLGAIWYADIAAHRETGGYTFGAIVNLGIEVMMRCGEREHIARLPLHAFRTVAALIRRVAGSGTRRLGRRVYLCPACGAAPDGEVCRACGTRFRSGAAVRLFALLIPGGGYVYAGYPAMGVCAGAVELSLLAAVAVQALAYANWGAAATSLAFWLWQKLAAVAHATLLARERVPADGGRQHRYLRARP